MSIAVGAVIQLSGFTLAPASFNTMKVPSALIISRRLPIGRSVVSLPV